MRGALLAPRAMLALTLRAGRRATDTFTRANSTTTLGSAETGQAWQVSPGCTWGIDANRARLVTIAGESLARVETGAADGTGQMRVAVRSGLGPRFVFRWSDDNNYLVASAQSATTLELWKRVAGVWQSISSVAYAWVNGDVLSVVLSGSSISVRVNGVERIAATDGFNANATQHGMQSTDVGARIDDFDFNPA